MYDDFSRDKSDVINTNMIRPPRMPERLYNALEGMEIV